MRVIPYSYTPSPTAIAGLEAVVARSFGGSAAMVVAPPVAYGAEDALAVVATAGAGTTLVALFNATATPEREAHGAFLVALARQRDRRRGAVRAGRRKRLARALGRDPARCRVGARRGAMGDEAARDRGVVDLPRRISRRPTPSTRRSSTVR